MAYDGSLLNYETLRFNVSDEGKTLIDLNGKYLAQVASSWKNIKAFESFLTDRLLGN